MEIDQQELNWARMKSLPKIELAKTALAKLALLAPCERAALSTREAMWASDPFVELKAGFDLLAEES